MEGSQSLKACENWKALFREHHGISPSYGLAKQYLPIFASHLQAIVGRSSFAQSSRRPLLRLRLYYLRSTNLAQIWARTKRLCSSLAVRKHRCVTKFPCTPGEALEQSQCWWSKTNLVYCWLSIVRRLQANPSFAKEGMEDLKLI